MYYTPPERELQPALQPIRSRPKGLGAEPAGTRSRIDHPALDARRMDVALIVTLPRASGPESRTRTLTTE